MSREAEQKVLGAMAEYMEGLVKRIEYLESKLDSAESDEGFRERVGSIVEGMLNDYDPTEHNGFNDAVDDRCATVVPDMIGDMDFSATISATTRRRR